MPSGMPVARIDVVRVASCAQRRPVNASGSAAMQRAAARWRARRGTYAHRASDSVRLASDPRRRCVDEDRVVSRRDVEARNHGVVNACAVPARVLHEARRLVTRGARCVYDGLWVHRREGAWWRDLHERERRATWARGCDLGAREGLDGSARARHGAARRGSGLGPEPGSARAFHTAVTISFGGSCSSAW